MISNVVFSIWSLDSDTFLKIQCPGELSFHIENSTFENYPRCSDDVYTCSGGGLILMFSDTIYSHVLQLILHLASVI